MPTEPKETTRTYKPGDVIETPDGFRVEIVAVNGKRIRIRHPLADGSEIVADVPVLTRDEPCNR
jgi:hypothetical protein